MGQGLTLLWLQEGELVGVVRRILIAVLHRGWDEQESIGEAEDLEICRPREGNGVLRVQKIDLVLIG